MVQTLLCRMQIRLGITLELPCELMETIIQLNVQPFKNLIHLVQYIALRDGHSDEIDSLFVLFLRASPMRNAPSDLSRFRREGKRYAVKKNKARSTRKIRWRMVRGKMGISW